MTIKKIILITTLCIIQFSCSKEYIKPVSVKRNFSGALWIVRHNISTPEKIDKLLGMIENTGIKNLFVQVRGRGDSYYNSEFEPAAGELPAGFDPLQYLLEKTSGKDIKIHAWINVFFVLSAKKSPQNNEHVLSKHPEWITYDYKGRPMTQYTEKELKDNLLEGYFLDPAIPEVKNYTVDIIKDILAKYPVDGIHLDFIRYPYSGYNSYHKKNLSDFGYNPISRAIFKQQYGVDPIKIDRNQNSEEKELFDQFRRDQVNDVVKKIYDAVKSKNEDLILSAAVMPRYDWGKKVYFQDWPVWLNEHYLDMVCIMSYSSTTSGFKNYINYANTTHNNSRIFMGINVKKKSSIKNTLERIKLSYDNDMRGYIIFSFKHDRDFIEYLDSFIKYTRNRYKY